MSQKWRSRIIDQAEVDPTSLRPNPLNWRQHPSTQQKALLGVLNEVGWVQQIIVNKRTGHLVDGHLRVEMACKNAESTVPVIYVDLTESEEATILASLDPLAALAKSDESALAELLRKTNTADAAVEALLASVAKENGVALQPIETGLTDPEELPSVQKMYVSRPGDVWLLGTHRVVCGDSADPSIVKQVIGEHPVSWMWTDPPYGVEYTGGTVEQLTIRNDHPDKIQQLLRSVFSTVNEVLQEGSPIYIAHPSGAHALPFIREFQEVGWHLHQELIWVKDQMAIGRSDYHYQHEPILYGWKGQKRTWVAGRDQTSIFELPRPKKSPDHPSMKPVKLIEQLLQNSSLRGSTGLDPFAGSGSTLIAAERLGRVCVAIELEPRYVDVIVRRWQEFTGSNAILEGESRDFLEIEEVRCGG